MLSLNMMGRFVCPDEPGSHNSLDVGRWWVQPCSAGFGWKATQLTMPGPPGWGWSCSSCSEEKSPMVPNPDPKQYWNNWKNDMSSFSATNQERPYKQLLHNYRGLDDGICTIPLKNISLVNPENFSKIQWDLDITKGQENGKICLL